MNFGSLLIIAGVGVLSYILGRIRGFFLAVKWLSEFQPEETNPFIEAQRESAPYQ